MSTFLYYIPKIQSVTPDDIKRVGITTIDTVNFGFCRVDRGPDSSSGVVFAVTPDNENGTMPKIGFYRHQTWIGCNNQQFYIGFETGNPPKPADLQRSELIGGHPILLGDGQKWTIPVARAFGRGSVLPHALVLGPDGELITEALPKFSELSQKAELVYDAFLNEGDDLTLSQCWEFALLALSQNYHLSKYEVSALKLLTTDNIQDVLGALVDLPTIIDYAQNQKKSQSEESSLNDGALA